MFILADTEDRCILVTVYYVDISTSVSLGDIIEIPKPVFHLKNIEWRKEVRQNFLFDKFLFSSKFRNFQFHRYASIRLEI